METDNIPVSVRGHAPTRGGKDILVKVDASSMMDIMFLDAIADMMIDHDMYSFTFLMMDGSLLYLSVSGTWLLNPVHFGDRDVTRGIAYGFILNALESARLI